MPSPLHPLRPVAGLMSAIALLVAAPIAFAGSVNEVKGLAIQGYDPVAYFTEQRAVQGSPKFKARHAGATYHFSTAAHRDSFAARPDRYAPRYGGFCAYGTAQGYKAAIDPQAFTIVDGRLYLNYNKEVQATWSKDVPGFITKADHNWPAVVKTTKVHR